MPGILVHKYGNAFSKRQRQMSLQATIPNIVSAEFKISVHHQGQLPPANLPEVAFLGRSNVGKSTLINTLLARKKLVRTSSRPGCTQALNFFLINDTWYFVVRLRPGLPGDPGPLGRTHIGLPGGAAQFGGPGLPPGPPAQSWGGGAFFVGKASCLGPGRDSGAH
jgi:hypothetical protein